MTTGWLPAPVEELFGPEATAEESYDVLTVDVPSASWTEALRTAHSVLGCTYFDWLSAVDEPGTGFRVAAHVVALSPVRRLLVRTTVPHESPALPTATGVYAGAAWHERETHEMFGVTFEGHPGLDPLLLPESFEGHPLRKDFVLAARVAKAWPGAKEPGESDHGGPKRRQMLPPGVPDPNEWGPLKGQLPPAPARPTRDRPSRAAGDRPARAAGDRPARAAGDRPVRRTRSASEGSASQAAGTADTAPSTPRRTRTAAEGSAGQTGAAPGSAPARRSRSAGEGSAGQRAEPATGDPSAAPRTERPDPKAPPAPRSTDAPWHHARPAFEEPEPMPKPSPEAAQGDTSDAEAEGGTQARKPSPPERPAPDPNPNQDPKANQDPPPKPDPDRTPDREPTPDPDQAPKPDPYPTPDRDQAPTTDDPAGGTP
ncbi:NADH-quinone oxidoreductase subunit C [Streptomyces phyllanthi]|uniref:NADH-quinone oxidoreductase subunit C n=1 Tax=Streptomyces phyllanthi TaxID=1803180 RepID=UPI003636B272